MVASAASGDTGAGPRPFSPSTSPSACQPGPAAPAEVSVPPRQQHEDRRAGDDLPETCQGRTVIRWATTWSGSKQRREAIGGKRIAAALPRRGNLTMHPGGTTLGRRPIWKTAAARWLSRSMILAAVGFGPATISQAEVKVSDFGKTADGTPVEEFTLTNATGAIVKLISRGATLKEWHVPDKNGEVGRRRLRLRRHRRLRIARQRILRLHGRPRRQSHRRRQVLHRRQAIHGRHQRRPQRAPRRRQAQPRQGRLEGRAVRIRRRRRRRLHVHQPRRRRGLSRRAFVQGHIHPHRQERAPHRLRSDHRPAHARQSHATTPTSISPAPARRRSTTMKS